MGARMPMTETKSDCCSIVTSNVRYLDPHECLQIDVDADPLAGLKSELWATLAAFGHSLSRLIAYDVNVLILGRLELLPSTIVNSLVTISYDTNSGVGIPRM
jgi:hypothetical protein